VIIVTGGAGFIGSNLIRALNDAGEDRILVVDRLGQSDKWKNLLGLSFRDYEHKDHFLQKLEQGIFDHGVWAVFHFGACSSTTEKDADYLMDNNFRFSTRLAMRFAARKGVRFIYASSAATYGDGSMGYSDDETALDSLCPLNIYGYSKHFFDIWSLRSGFLKHAVGLKFFNVFGPNEYHKADMRSVAIRAYFQARDSGLVRLFKSYRSDFHHGDQCRDFIYVKDAVKIALHFLERPDLNGIYNAGTGLPRTFNELALAVFSALEMRPSIEYVDMPEGLEKRYQYHTCAEMDNLKGADFKGEFLSLEQSVRDYVVNYLNPYYEFMRRAT